MALQRPGPAFFHVFINEFLNDQAVSFYDSVVDGNIVVPILAAKEKTMEKADGGGLSFLFDWQEQLPKTRRPAADLNDDPVGIRRTVGRQKIREDCGEDGEADDGQTEKRTLIAQQAFSDMAAARCHLLIFLSFQR